MPDFSIFCALRCAVLFKSTALSVKKTAHAGIRHERFFGRSGIIGFHEITNNKNGVRVIGNQYFHIFIVCPMFFDCENRRYRYRTIQILLQNEECLLAEWTWLYILIP